MGNFGEQKWGISTSVITAREQIRTATGDTLFVNAGAGSGKTSPLSWTGSPRHPTPRPR